MSLPAEYNVDAWLDRNSPQYKPELAQAIFHYRARKNASQRFQICIQTDDMKKATWRYSHQQQLILDGTFGICDCRVLLFIALGVDEDRKGVPLAFFLFSAPPDNLATQSGYDARILTDLLREWVASMGKQDNRLFCPRVAITDTDTKERAALCAVWPDIWLLLCRFHLRQCWTNKRHSLLKAGKGKTYNFPREQIKRRLQLLEKE
jgi:hypothetical protein